LQGGVDPAKFDIVSVDVDKIIEDTRQSVERMKALTNKTKALLRSNDSMIDASDALQAGDAAQPEQGEQQQETPDPPKE
jgi:hypothetical protein